MISFLAKSILRNKKINSYLRNLYDEVRDEGGEPKQISTSIAEAEPLQCCPSDFCSHRLNLLVPAIALRHFFGGISTALVFFTTLADEFEHVRIILTDQRRFKVDDNPAFSKWQIGSLDADDSPGKWIIPAGDRYGKTLPVAQGDRFVATSWWTAISARSIQSWQCSHFKFDAPAKFVYLIQDFEPCFYPWSSRYALAESTYHHTDDSIAVFNTSLLKQFFDEEGYDFPSHYIFEPRLNKELLASRTLALKQPRENRVLIYGRPSTARNAFEIIVMGLRLWMKQNPNSDWCFLSAGESHPSIDIGHGKKLTSLGKLPLEEYAMELGRCRVGLSLMISPHPSYPPLEMAAFGMQVITNNYKSKNMSKLSSCFYSIETVSPEKIALALDALTKNPDMGKSNISEDDLIWQSYLEGDSNFENMRSPIMKQLGLS